MLTPRWCRIRDLNPYAIRHQNLNLTCLPIPPIRQIPRVIRRYKPISIIGLLLQLSKPLARPFYINSGRYSCVIFYITNSHWCRSYIIIYTPVGWRQTGSLAAPVGFEPTTLRLTAACSASWAKGPYLRKRKVSVLQTVSFHYTSSPVRITDGVISLMTISPSLSSSFFILHIYYIIFFIKNQKRFFNGDRVGFDTNIIHRSFTLTKNYFSDLIPPRTTAVVFIKRPTK